MIREHDLDVPHTQRLQSRVVTRLRVNDKAWAASIAFRCQGCDQCLWRVRACQPAHRYGLVADRRGRHTQRGRIDSRVKESIRLAG